MKATRQTIPTLIENREQFTNTSGTVRALVKPSAHVVEAIIFSDESQLNEDEKTRLRIDNRENGIAYLVMSYRTPVAWETENGHVYKVTQELSQTTTKHCGLLYLFHERHAESD